MFTEIWEMEDLRKRVLFTLGMLGAYRLGIFIPSPGIDRLVLGQWFNNQGNSLFGMYDMFSGGALSQFSVFMLGIMPYITASIVMQLLAEMVPQLKRIKDEGQTGRQKITQYTRYLTIVVACVQSYGWAYSMEQMRVGTSGVVIDPGWGFRLLTMLTMTSGSCFIMWLGEQITERGVGNGSSIIIGAGIIDRLPASLAQMVTLVQVNEVNLLQATLMLGFMFLVVYAIVFVERGQRRVPLQYAKRVLGRSVYEGQTTYLPLKVNIAGTVPPIFASSLLMVPTTVGQFYNSTAMQWLATAFYPGRWLYNVVYVVMIMFFAFFYTAITFNPEDVAENIKKQGGYIPRVRPGKETATYIDWLVTRLTAGGSIYLGVLCILPTIMITQYHIPLFQLGGTGMLIVVGVTLDTVAQIEAQLSTRHYDGVVATKGRVRGRRQPIGTQQSGS
ncbi:MAG: preprotein translocase subunit SecY [Alphaproteobacteria bacterium]|nr:preprotein translocase subunit SecY [Alphaproteobacteria bacterium]MCB9696138.1 preprotein translocase subunit SecY [Alphaproteobacteria bacterium]